MCRQCMACALYLMCRQCTACALYLMCRQCTTCALYLSIVYVLQYYYQSGCLYRLRCLGQRHTMDITVEGFMSWMWKGLVFLLPFLMFGYVTV
nr:hypothetical protein BaRGS_022404 [Batillaria attramentaria]